ncbi:MAG: contact-dependent growth inhibition system immunity protein [Aquisalinus sp.]|nr:contact-dependent growth inhibition system immunity protein [Aquisalinus sp.]
MKKWASVDQKDNYIFIVAMSGNRGIAGDYDAYSNYIVKPFDEGQLGLHVKKALEASRFLEYGSGKDEEIDEFFDVKSRQMHAKWQKNMTSLLKCKSEEEFYKGFKNVGIELEEKIISITSFYEDGNGGYISSGSSDDVLRIYVQSSNSEVGKAVIAALSKAK